MKIEKIKVENFRLLKDFEVFLEDELSLVIGKNNTGKTSLLAVLNKFLNKPDNSKFFYEDFNLDFMTDLQSIIKGEKSIDEEVYRELGIRLSLFVEYTETDNLANINRVMMDLDPDNNFIVLGFEYVLSYKKLTELQAEYQNFKTKQDAKAKAIKEYKQKEIDVFLKSTLNDFFTIRKKSIEYNISKDEINDGNFIDLDSENISLKEIINFQYISAKREVSNKDADKTLSVQTSKIYKKSEESDEQKDEIEKFKDQLFDTDEILSGIYSKLFEKVIKTVSDFGGVKEGESIIEVLSTLQHKELLDGNTTVMYNHNESSLPEHYNGLGYLNLISILFEIEILIQEFKKKKDEVPADINLLFIEEPEAHTHPQMQNVFIKNIKSLLREGIKRDDGQSRKLQYIISTHSSHIVAESNFDDIKYIKKKDANEVIANSLKSLELEYKQDGEEQNFRFLKQYLTLNRAELFFADKAILIEGDTERILLPAMMKKVDQEESKNPLLSQNISIVEVGAHSQIFEKFIDFIGVKSLILTDIDSYYIEEVNGENETIKCPANDPNAKFTSNTSLNFFFKNKQIDFYKKLSKEKRIIAKTDKKEWKHSDKGILLITYQSEESSYHARSFEDAFFTINKDFIKSEDNNFASLTKKWMDKFKQGDCTEFMLAEKGVGSKPSLAIEILLNSNTNDEGHKYSNWDIPSYIKEGLLWLKKD